MASRKLDRLDGAWFASTQGYLIDVIVKPRLMFLAWES